MTAVEFRSFFIRSATPSRMALAMFVRRALPPSKRSSSVGDGGAAAVPIRDPDVEVVPPGERIAAEGGEDALREHRAPLPVGPAGVDLIGHDSLLVLSDGGVGDRDMRSHERRDPQIGIRLGEEVDLGPDANLAPLVAIEVAPELEAVYDASPPSAARLEAIRAGADEGRPVIGQAETDRALAGPVRIEARPERRIDGKVPRDELLLPAVEPERQLPRARAVGRRHREQPDVPLVVRSDLRRGGRRRQANEEVEERGTLYLHECSFRTRRGRN